MNKRIVFFLLLAIMVIALLSACESEAPGPVDSQPPRVDSLFIFIVDTTVIYDSTTVFDTTVVYDSTVVFDTTIIFDTVVVYDTTVIYDSTVVFDTVVYYDTLVIIDSVFVSGDSLVYQDCLILKDGTTTGTLGAPGYFVTMERDKVNGHGIKFCLYVYRQEDGYTGVLSATHLKSDWPVVCVDVTVNSDPPFVWKLDAQHQTKDIVF
ncbi:MAG: hypothetical protein A2406_03215 [Candidatus Komeilibacteria bacterium RIFOXYC1_FULL_37_11]|uniref:Cohesin domain-containing protein n=1 Tax=Candidatus Komeilibacteria bacterium RIFOXYC1_FULL_37_11 TaxID=1798555 RepID=A0A1G2C073_9BACT|nr:MAG: hypothetical protein A2406_03215 [Candidatus Komeilibacteria bacterium RIFOXYC1_FULL_37_11]OGY95954.1 MAG: hypothetical protein A2611_03975 [Candidatus Komeilibacteria bacterium RIFOXYD1_FULL_37_29]